MTPVLSHVKQNAILFPIMENQMSFSETKKNIDRLKKEKNAVILAHYYTPEEVQACADFTGDSFYLAQKARETDCSTIIFAGVNFMGESAKMLNPNKKVLMPDMSADCPMAHMVTKKTVDEARSRYEDLAVVCYINSTAEIKSWSDVCVTSANAVKVVKSLSQKNILFIPDKNLARYVADKCPEKNFIFNNGFCPRHEFIDAAEIQELKDEHPAALVLAHPECNEKVLELADYIGSTSGIIKYSSESECKEFIIATEVGVNYELTEKRDDAEFYFPRTRPVCVNMKKNTLQKLADVLEKEDNEIFLPPEETTRKATETLEKMLEACK